MNVICGGCSTPFEVEVATFNKNNREGYKFYCSKACFNNYRSDQTAILVNCSVCGAEVRRYRRLPNKTGRYYCKKCRGMTKMICANADCRKPMTRSNHDVRKYINLYCSSKCKHIGERKQWNDVPRSNLKTRYIAVFGIESIICNRCGYSKSYNIQIHHKIYVSKGGSNHPDNLEPLCRNCHGEEHYENGDDYDNNSNHVGTGLPKLDRAVTKKLIYSTLSLT